MTIGDILRCFEHVKPSGQDAWMARCPCPDHQDLNNSLSVKALRSKVLLNCFAGCSATRIVTAVNLTMRDLFFDAPAPTQPGRLRHARLTLEAFAVAKGLPVDFLAGQGVVQNGDALRITYRLRDGSRAPRQRRRSTLAAKD